MELEGLVDLAAERQRLEKEIKRTTEAIAFSRGKLSRPDFTERAPAEIVDKEREKLAEQAALHAKLVASLSWWDDALWPPVTTTSGTQRPRGFSVAA